MLAPPRGALFSYSVLSNSVAWYRVFIVQNKPPFLFSFPFSLQSLVQVRSSSLFFFCSSSSGSNSSATLSYVFQWSTALSYVFQRSTALSYVFQWSTKEGRKNRRDSSRGPPAPKIEVCGSLSRHSETKNVSE